MVNTLELVLSNSDMVINHLFILTAPNRLACEHKNMVPSLVLPYKNIGLNPFLSLK